MRGRAHRGERLEEGVENARLAQSPETFPDAVPIAKLNRKRTPVDVVNREIMQRFKEFAVVAALVAPA
jgi:hypothetical protein